MVNLNNTSKQDWFTSLFSFIVILPDENPINCERFLIDKGLDEFMACYNRYAADERKIIN
jgi:hypothetical protein